MKTYSEKLRDPRWQRKRLEIMQRDNFACIRCGDTKTTLNVHHANGYKRGAAPWEYPDSELQTLCENCHSREHSPPISNLEGVVMAEVQRTTEWLTDNGFLWNSSFAVYPQLDALDIGQFLLPDIETIIHFDVEKKWDWEEAKRLDGIVRELHTTFVVLRECSYGDFKPVDMYGPLAACDSFDPKRGDGVNWGWHSEAPQDREISMDNAGGRMSTQRFYIGPGCCWRWKNGRDCPCTN